MVESRSFLRPPLEGRLRRRRWRGVAVVGGVTSDIVTNTKNGCFATYTSSVSLRLPPSPQGEGFFELNCVPQGFGLVAPCFNIATARSCLPLTRVRVSGGHLCAAEAPTEAGAETVDFAKQKTEGEKRILVFTYMSLPQSRCRVIVFAIKILLYILFATTRLVV